MGKEQFGWGRRQGSGRRRRVADDTSPIRRRCACRPDLARECPTITEESVPSSAAAVLLFVTAGAPAVRVVTLTADGVATTGGSISPVRPGRAGHVTHCADATPSWESRGGRSGRRCGRRPDRAAVTVDEART
jgi:hypothetical protein